jgi:hypothetical protein
MDRAARLLQWRAGSGATYRFTGGDNVIRYHIALPFGSLTDKLNRAVPTNDCRNIYMAFAPRFERTEEELEDGCFLVAGVRASDATWGRGRHLSAHGWEASERP